MTMVEKKMKKVWDNCILVGEVLRSNRTKIKIELVSREGVKYINMRDWYQKKSDNEWKPGLSGFAVPIMIPVEGEVTTPAADLYELIEEALLAAPNFELVNDDNAVWTEVKPRR